MKHKTKKPIKADLILNCCFMTWILVIWNALYFEKMEQKMEQNGDFHKK